MSSVEQRRVLCSVTFHVVAITCVIWSLYVLIDRTAVEIKSGKLDFYHVISSVLSLFYPTIWYKISATAICWQVHSDLDSL